MIKVLQIFYDFEIVIWIINKVIDIWIMNFFKILGQMTILGPKNPQMFLKSWKCQKCILEDPHCIKNWEQLSIDRGVWRRLIEEAKVLIGLQCHWWWWWSEQTLKDLKNPRGTNVVLGRVDLANWALRSSPKFTIVVKHQFHQGFWPEQRSGNPKDFI